MEHLDEEYPPEERFPRRMSVRIREETPGTAVMDVEGVRTGNPLTDNNRVNDGYRFHDVFHLAHIAYLGWSPVHRALMGLRRKSDPRTAAVEDGRRAISTEEGLAAIIFSYARTRSFLEGATGIEPSLWRTVRDMTARLEVSVRTREEWADAIIEGYSCWRLVREWRGGDLVPDMDIRAMDIFPPRD